MDYEQFQDLNKIAEIFHTSDYDNCRASEITTEFSKLKTEIRNSSRNDKPSSKNEEKISSPDLHLKTFEDKDPAVNKSSETDEENFSIEEFQSSEDLRAAMAKVGQQSVAAEGSLSKTPQVVSWIRCDKPECQKWRKLDVDDVTSLSHEKWYCSQNPDPARNSCDFSEEDWSCDSADESMYANYKPGVVVLGKMPGYPWWPGIVEDDPDFDSFFYLHRRGKNIIKVKLHVFYKKLDPARPKN